MATNIQPTPPAAGWASLAEANEANVYESLVATAHVPGFEVSRVTAAVALRSTAAPSVLVVNRVLGCGERGVVDRAFLDRLVALYGGAGFGIEIDAPGCTTEVLAQLRALRFHRVSSSQMMVCEAARGPAAGRYETWARSTGLRIERVGEEHTATVARVCCENFKVPPSLGALLQAGTSDGGWRRWLAFDGDVAVGASLSHVRGEAGWFGWTSVNPSHRGRWVHAGFVARQFEDAVESGCRWITTDTVESTRQRPDPVYLNLKRFGFVDLYLRPLFVRAPAHRPG